MSAACIGLIALTGMTVVAAEVPRPQGGGDHTWMAYAAFCALSEEDRAWLAPEIPAFISTYTHLPDANWNNYGTFGGWSGLPDQPRTPDVRREWEIHEFTGFNQNTGAGRRFDHSPAGLYPAIPWYLPRIVERFRRGEFMRPIIQLGCLSHLVQDCSTFPHMQALHRAARFDVTKISIEGYEPQSLGKDLDAVTKAMLERTKAMVAWCDQRAPELRAAMQSGDAVKEQQIRVACCGEACKVLADLYHSLIALVGECPRPGPPAGGENLVLNPGVEEEDPGERLPRHWVVGYNDLKDRLGRALWEGQIIRNARMWHGGRRSLKVMWTPEQGLEWRQTWPSSVYVRPGEFYVASAWAKVYDGTGRTNVILAFYRSDLTPLQEFASPSIEGRTDWQKLTVAAEVPEGAVRARVILRSAANEGAAWFDDIELCRVERAAYERARQAEPTGDRLVLHLPFDTDVRDHSRFGQLNSPIVALSGAKRANLVRPKGHAGGCAHFDGQDDFVEVPHSYVEDVLSPGGAMTITLWVKAERAGPALLCGKAAEGPQGAKGYRLDLTSDGKIRFAVAVDGKLSPSAEAAAPIGEWAHIAAVRTEAGEMSVYVNGQPGAVVRRPGKYEPSPKSFYVGADYGVKDFFAGDLDDLRLFRAALSPEEIGDLLK